MSKELSIQQRQEQEKSILIEQLKKTPIVQIACEKTGTGRTTYYRWRKENQEFAKEADVALKEGKSLVNDVAESQLLGAIREGNMTAIIFWLKNHHNEYATRVEVTAKLAEQDPLNPEQEALIREAIRLAALPLPPSSHGDISTNPESSD